jgi:hypothetical protein
VSLRFQQAAKLEREIISGLDRSLKRAERKPGWLAQLGTERQLDRLCRVRPDTVRETVRELALMRAGWQRISYRKALRQIVRASLKHGPSIDTPPGF